MTGFAAVLCVGCLCMAPVAWGGATLTSRIAAGLLLVVSILSGVLMCLSVQHREKD